MKRFLIMPAAMLAFMSCTKDIQEINQEIETEGTAFVAGQEVTIRCGEPQTKVSGTETGDKTISFLWEAGDKIKVTVSGVSSTFTLQSGAGTKTATFVGNMPASGTTFDIQYPETDPDLSTQTYSEGKLPAGKMKFTASDCTLDATANLTAAYAALRLNLYGGAREVSQIVVTGSSAATYTLSISSAVTVGKDKENATPFFIVLPATESFVSAAVTANAITSTIDNTKSYESYGLGYPISASTTLTPTEAQSLIAGRILNMPAVSLTTVWAPVNCGYEPATTSPAYKGYPYGKLYQWGRKDGQGYNSNDATYPSGTNIVTGPISDIREASAEKFYKVTASPYNWYSGSSPAANDLWKEDGSSTYDPCPEGWRVPTGSELTALRGSHTSEALQDGSGVHSGMKGKYFDGSAAAIPTSGVFLPAAGYRRYYDCSAINRGYNGYYWSSSVYGDYARILYFNGSSASMEDYGRVSGCPVRCVQE